MPPDPAGFVLLPSDVATAKTFSSLLSAVFGRFVHLSG
jgi:hypothetical protein